MPWALRVDLKFLRLENATCTALCHIFASKKKQLCEAMEFLLTDEELHEVERLLPTIAKKHGLQCSFTFVPEVRAKAAKGKGKGAKAKGKGKGKGKEAKKVPKPKKDLKATPEPKEVRSVRKEPAKAPAKALKRSGEPLESPKKMPGSPIVACSESERSYLSGMVDELSQEEQEQIMQTYSSWMKQEDDDSPVLDIDHMTRGQRTAFKKMLEDMVSKKRQVARLPDLAAVMLHSNDMCIDMSNKIFQYNAYL